ncbi:D-alanine--D-alanine ligase [Roseateles saccharophilus]|uniref:D-alanine--D-alanine ligase n=1 Tax=Roseateles saccharophilus TaxID=304 RepID=A0A4R3VEQ4_ROSSA|nr:D-alanine--D-alanine ligase [Roseateles saccharophilus]MDG0833017.1 D-alanine--D-alanine ligase [Roseateles saccharophilus]TCV02109.1 D-alanine-D-alanine ligase [Roseateles saccharophilus]
MSNAPIDLNVDAKALGKVAVLLGGISAERPVSLMSGSGVLDALTSLGVDAHAFDPAERPLQALKDEGFERAFIALHGRGGEDGTLQGALEWLGIPYTGSGVTASGVAMDKTMTKRVWAAEGLTTPQYLALGRAELTRERIRAIPDELGLPVIVKPPHEGSSIGITKAAGYSDMQGAVELALGFDDELLFEQCIEGPEVTCAVLGQGDTAVALPVVEIRAEAGNYDFENKYHTDTTQYLFGTLPAALEAEIQQLVLKAYQLLGCRGWGRADLMLRKSDMKPFLLEMNTSPGMTSHSLVPKAAKAVGIAYPQLCLWLLSQARLDRK